MDFRMKRIADMRDVAGKLDCCASGSDFNFLESMLSQPVRHGLNVSIRRSELCTKLLWGKPFMKIGRVLAQLLVHEFTKGGLLFGATLQDEHHPFHGRGVSDDALVEFGAGEGMDVALQADELGFVDGLGDARRDGCGLCGGSAIRRGLGSGAKRGQRQDHSKDEKGIARHRGLKFHSTPTVQNSIQFQPSYKLQYLKSK